MTGNLIGTTKTLDGRRTIVDPNGYRVELFYADHGGEGAVRDNDKPFTFSTCRWAFTPSAW